jgi:E3 ubiquitin-protein ligase SIAH1
MKTAKRDLRQGIMSELECPVCMEYMLPPIELCENGHNICSNCKPKIRECPTCNKPLLNVRNFTLENLTRKVEYPCTYRKFGCKETHSVDFIIDHQSTCVYAPFTCPFFKDRKCSWANILKNLKKHLQECHSEDVKEQDGDTYLIINPDSYELKGCKVMLAYNEIFFIYIRRRVNRYYVVVTYVGKPENACQYGYRISFKRSGSVESITVCHASRSVNEDLDKIVGSGDCFNLSHDLLKRYVTRDGRLRYKLDIFKV